ncbi:hypothetical protein DYB32_001099 [Aphanomyces invadans]|uniref:Uncharacterized protein n=1 Tax=Aphanomyces invadans TaxID=157072 RepID=A0A3R6WST3_9STRA|nr:hypothetical protein DYB32_001099 [Aphanomyces invadans]
MYRHRVPHVVHDVASLPQCLCFRTVHGPGFGSTTTKRLFQLPEHTLSDAATVAMATWTTTEDGRYGNSTMLGQATSLRPLSQSSWVYFGLATGVLRVDSVSIVNPAVDAEPVKLKTSLPRQAAPLNPVAVTTTQLRMATSLTAIRKVAFLGQNAWLLLSDMHHAIMVYAVRKDGTVVELPTHSLVCPRRIATIATSPCLPYFCITYGYVTPATMELVAVSKSHGCTRHDVPLTHKATCAEFACFGSQVAVGEKRVQYGVLRILNAETKRTNMLVEDAHFGGIQFLRWIPQQHNFVFSVGHDHTMKLWDTTKKECVLAYQLHATAPSDILVTCTAAMECTIVVSTFSKQVEKWTIGSLHHLLQSVSIERSYAIVLIQKHWRGVVLIKPKMDEIRDAASSLQKLLAALEAQESEDQSPVCVKAAKLKARVLKLEQKLKNVVDEKEYWLRRCVEYEASFATMVRRTRSNSELREMADTFANPPSKGHSPRSKHASTLVEDLTNAPSIPSMIKAKRASFRLLQCSDEECEVFTSLNRTIQTQCRAKNNVQLMWDTSPTAVLLVKKPNEPNVSRTMREVAAWLMHDKHMRVFLEPKVHDEEGLAGTVTWTDSQDWLTKQHEIDLVVSFGGDGTVMTSFDGKVRVEMKSGDTLHVRVSTFPLPSVCNLNENEDWFASVKSNLNWNQRKEMKPFFPNAAPTSSSSSVDGLE